MMPLRTVLASASALLLVSCILVVSPERFGDQCRIAGEETQCGACVVERCQAAANDCCLTDSCSATLRAVETCGNQHDGSCAFATDAASNSLAKCVAESCGGVCVPLAGTPSTACREPPIAQGGSCSCTYAGPGAGNDFVCDPKAYAQTICCAPKGWPGAGQECVCKSIDCAPRIDGCSCITIEHASANNECTGAICCSDHDSCRCSSEACFSFQTQVPSCTLAVLACDKDQIRVDSCSLRAP